MRNLSILGACLAAIALGGVAQENKEHVFRADTRLVVLHASVANKNGQLMPNLKQKDFHVYENEVEQPVKLFKREDVPVSLGLIVDNSGSMRDKRQKVEAAALALVKASNPRDEVMVVNFNDEAFEDVPFTGDHKKMEEGLTRIDSRGGTAMRDAISMSIDQVKKKAKHDKQVLVVITDGNDNTSSVTLEKLVAKAHQSEILLYLVGLLSEEEKREAKKAKRALDALAQASGGSASYPKDLSEVERTTVQIANEIRNQYVIGYTPLNPELDGTFRRVKIIVDAPGKPVARTRSGYYARPLQASGRPVSQASVSQPQ